MNEVGIAFPEKWKELPGKKWKQSFVGYWQRQKKLFEEKNRYRVAVAPETSTQRLPLFFSPSYNN